MLLRSNAAVESVMQNSLAVIVCTMVYVTNKAYQMNNDKLTLETRLEDSTLALV